MSQEEKDLQNQIDASRTASEFDPTPEEKQLADETDRLDETRNSPH